MKRKTGLISLLAACCLFFAGGVFGLLPKATQKADALAVAVTSGAHTVSSVVVHPDAMSNNGVFCYFTEGNVALAHDLEDGNNESNNTYLANFANQLKFNGGAFETTGVGGKLNTQGHNQNWFIEKTNGSTSTALAANDYFLIPQGSVFQTSSVTFTFSKNFKIMYTGSATCPTTSDGVNCLGAGYCNHGVHVFAWESTTASATIDNISLHPTSGGKNNAYLRFWSAGLGALNNGIANGETSLNNTYLQNFANVLKFNGGSFADVCQIVSQGSENVLFQKKDGSNFAEGDVITFAQGTQLLTDTVSWTFAANYKIYASGKTCTELAGCTTAQNGGTSEYCRAGFFHVYKWTTGSTEPEVGLPNVTTHSTNTAVLVSAMTKTNGTTGTVPYFYNTKGYAVSFDMLNHHGASFGLVIGNMSSIIRRVRTRIVIRGRGQRIQYK